MIAPLERLRELVAKRRKDEAKIAETEVRRQRERLRLARKALRGIEETCRELLRTGWRLKSGRPVREWLQVNYGSICQNPGMVRKYMRTGKSILVWPRVTVRLGDGGHNPVRGDIEAEAREGRVLLNGINMHPDRAGEQFLELLLQVLDVGALPRAGGRRLRKLG